MRATDGGLDDVYRFRQNGRSLHRRSHRCSIVRGIGDQRGIGCKSSRFLRNMGKGIYWIRTARIGSWSDCEPLAPSQGRLWRSPAPPINFPEPPGWFTLPTLRGACPAQSIELWRVLATAHQPGRGVESGAFDPFQPKRQEQALIGSEQAVLSFAPHLGRIRSWATSSPN